MRYRSFAGYVVAAGLLAFSVACSREMPSAPTPPVAPAPNASLLGLSFLTNGLLRTTPLASDVTVRGTLGTAGGTVSIPSLGITLTVPAGAVSAPTTFAITAKAGPIVAYEFEPHGTTFNVPLTFTQSLRGTNYGLLGVLSPLKVAYFADASQLNEKDGTAWVNELLPSVVSVLTMKVTANIKHFSGYMVSSGE